MISSASCKGAAAVSLLLVAVEKVDAVIDAYADDDGHEHHREQREIPHHERGKPKRPAETQGEHAEHHQRLHHATAGDDQQYQGQTEGEHGCDLGVAERRDHLIAGQRSRPGHARLDIGKLTTQARDRRADTLDDITVVREAALLAVGFREHQEQPIVVREEVAGAPAFLRIEREGPGGS